MQQVDTKFFLRLHDDGYHYLLSFLEILCIYIYFYLPHASALNNTLTSMYTSHLHHSCSLHSLSTFVGQIPTDDAFLCITLSLNIDKLQTNRVLEQRLVCRKNVDLYNFNIN